MSPEGRVPASFWWRSARANFDNVVREMLAKAKSADLRETGHDCGHQWTVSITGQGHYGIAGEGPESHKDSPILDVMRPVTVRAHNLHEALLLAAAEPLESYLQLDEEEPE